MRILKSPLIAFAGLALTAQAAFAAPQPVTFTLTAGGSTVALLPPQSVAPYKGSFNGGSSIFDVYCIDALNDITPNVPGASFTTRLGVDALDKTRLGNLTPGGPDNLRAYMSAAYIANKIRLGLYTTPSQLAAAQLAMWVWTSAYTKIYPGVNLGSLDWGVPDNSTTEGAQINHFLGYPGINTPYDWATIANDAFFNALTLTADWNPNDWIVISDANWSARQACFSIDPKNPTDDHQNCIQEFVKYDVIPEPATMGLMALGLVGVGLAGARRRNRK
jgi:hypothetical protein